MKATICAFIVGIVTFSTATWAEELNPNYIRYLEETQRHQEAETSNQDESNFPQSDSEEDEVPSASHHRDQGQDEQSTPQPEDEPEAMGTRHRGQEQEEHFNQHTSQGSQSEDEPEPVAYHHRSISDDS